MLASALSNAFTLITALLHLRFIKRFYADNGVVTLALVIESLVKNRLNIFTPRIDYGTCYVVLSLLTEFYGVTIQIIPFRQNFCMVTFVFQYFTK